MDDLIEPPTRRELVIAVIAGALLAVAGLAATARGANALSPPAPSPWRGGLGRGDANRWYVSSTAVTPLLTPPHPGEGDRGNVSRASCRIFNRLPDGSTNIGSGTLIDVTADGRRGLVLSCAH